MTENVSIVDYGSGNLLSVARAFEKIGSKVRLITKPDEVLQAERLVLPGVGAFAASMHLLKEKNLEHAIREYFTLARPFLGICVGMQLMFESSEEFGYHHGFSVLPGHVKKMNFTLNKSKIPFIGWARLRQTNNKVKSAMSDALHGKWLYLVHSYMAIPKEKKHQISVYNYNELEVSAFVQDELLLGCQFHPEKSGTVGLNFLREYMLL